MAFGNVQAVFALEQLLNNPGPQDSQIFLLLLRWPVAHQWAKMWNDMGCHAVLTGGVCMKPSKSGTAAADDDDDYKEN
uniref:Uncharacterized protein n=1 Tax=Ditylenchus dipsaci TaxID=166011 RepID=A0A915DPU1_9BILA